MTCYYRRENLRRDAILRGRNMTLGDYNNDMKWEEREKGDDALFFRYTV
jgi:MFS transporter, ACS family, DAL5 transporter family protein